MDPVRARQEKADYLIRFDAAPYPEVETAILIAYHYAIQGQRDEAPRFLQAVLDDPPVSAIQAILWRRELGDYLEKLNP